VRDRGGRPRAHVYFEDEPGRPSAAKLLSKDEARRIAASVAKLTDDDLDELAAISPFSGGFRARRARVAR
jgi:hypothetical protein